MKSGMSGAVGKYYREPARKVRATARLCLALARAIGRLLVCKLGSEPQGRVRLSLLCPTRKRPLEMARMWESAIDTAESPESIEVVFYLDNDDAFGALGLKLSAHRHSKQVRAVVGERMTLSQCWNSAADVARGEILMLCGDDIVFHSKGWDHQVVEAFESVADNIMLVHGRDGLWDEKMGTHPFIHRDWAKVTGYFVPPYFSSDYNDVWLHEVAEKIGRRKYLADLYTEHMHYSLGKAGMDFTYEERLRRHKADGVEQIWEDTAELRERDAEKLLLYIRNAEVNPRSPEAK